MIPGDVIGLVDDYVENAQFGQVRFDNERNLVIYDISDKCHLCFYSCERFFASLAFFLFTIFNTVSNAGYNRWAG